MAIKDGICLKQLSKTVSHALRHDPGAYGLVLDSEGWASVTELVQSLRTKKSTWRHLTESHIGLMVQTSRKHRHEQVGAKIRALYGHTIVECPHYVHEMPPELLLHGTDAGSVGAILAEGLKSMNRKFVHLTTDRSYASRARSKKVGPPVILEIQARAAAFHGIDFYHASDLVWLCDSVPARFISRLKKPCPAQSVATETVAGN
jgi:putative RNA 2'-phosphotransferase